MESSSDYVPPRVLDRTQPIERQLESLGHYVFDETKLRRDMVLKLRLSPVPGWFAHIRYGIVCLRPYLALFLAISGPVSILCGSVGILQGFSATTGAWMGIEGLISLVIGVLIMK